MKTDLIFVQMQLYKINNEDLIEWKKRYFGLFEEQKNDSSAFQNLLPRH